VLSDPESLLSELKELIVETLFLEDVTAAEIGTDAPLFVEGLGLDSIDSLELAMVLEERYGVALNEDPDENRRIFESVKSVSEFVSISRTK
jgi:acyl carrier protein